MNRRYLMQLLAIVVVLSFTLSYCGETLHQTFESLVCEEMVESIFFGLFHIGILVFGLNMLKPVGQIFPPPLLHVVFRFSIIVDFVFAILYLIQRNYYNMGNSLSDAVVAMLFLTELVEMN